MIINEFIKSFPALLDASIEGDFIDEVNPVDGVTYPLICKDIPAEVESEIIANLTAIKGSPVDVNVMFMRRSPEGVDCPQKVHSDNSMGKYSLMLYINGGQTSIVKHRASGISYAPANDEYIKIIQADQNNDDAWDIVELMGGQPNIAAIFDSNRLHRAEPVGGFGSGKDSRVVLTCFFS